MTMTSYRDGDLRLVMQMRGTPETPMRCLEIPVSSLLEAFRVSAIVVEAERIFRGGLQQAVTCLYRIERYQAGQDVWDQVNPGPEFEKYLSTQLHWLDLLEARNAPVKPRLEEQVPSVSLPLPAVFVAQPDRPLFVPPLDCPNFLDS